MNRIVVVGANHAGTAVINRILDYAPGQKVTVFDANSNISFLGCGMALWIGNQIRGPEGLFYATKEMLEEKGAEIHMDTPVQRIDYQKKIVYARCPDGKEIQQSYDKLILATGSLPIVPNIPGRELKNVQQVKLYQNAQEVIEKLKDPTIQKVAVVGAGYIGVELAEAFARNGREVTLIDCASTCLSTYYDEKFTKMMADNLAKHGVRLAFGEKVERLEGQERLQKVITDKNEYDADMAVLAIGFRPNTALGKEHLELFQNGAYLVDRYQRTSDPDVYAIGDCATVYDNALDAVNYIALATNAVRSGIIAGNNVCADNATMESIGVQGSNGIHIWGLNMVSTGLTLSKAEKAGLPAAATDYEDLQKPAFIETDNEKVTIRIVYNKETRVILGAQMVSRYDISMGINLFSLAVQEKITIDRIKLMDIFFLPHFNQPYNYITMAALSAK